ncbi:MAG TPA: hypothetical protein DIW81_27535, partial [Planctomycetaceae bacterium]
MSRKRNNSDTLEAGSDSFLDIVANIVGILIILIVIAGVRMTQAPPSPIEVVESIEEDTPPQPLILPPVPNDRVSIPEISEVKSDSVAKSIPIIARLGESEEFPLRPDKQPIAELPQNNSEFDQLQSLLNAEELKNRELSVTAAMKLNQLNQLTKTADLLEQQTRQIDNQISELENSQKNDQQSFLQLQGQL